MAIGSCSGGCSWLASCHELLCCPLALQVRSSRQDQIHNSIVSTLLALMDGLDSRGQAWASRMP